MHGGESDLERYRRFMTRLIDSVSNAFAQRRPCSEIVDETSFSCPESFSEAALRIRKNYSHFRVNYLSLIAVTLALSLSLHHSLLDGPLPRGLDHPPSLPRSFSCLLTYGLMFGLAIVCLRRIFNVTDDLVLGKQKPVATGLLSCLGDAPSNVGPSSDAPVIGGLD